MNPAGAPWIAEFIATLRNELALHLHARSLEMLRSSIAGGARASVRERARRPAGPGQPGPRQGQPDMDIDRDVAPRTLPPRPAPAGAPAAPPSSIWTATPDPARAPASLPGLARLTGPIMVVHAPASEGAGARRELMPATQAGLIAGPAAREYARTAAHTPAAAAQPESLTSAPPPWPAAVVPWPVPGDPIAARDRGLPGPNSAPVASIDVPGHSSSRAAAAELARPAQGAPTVAHDRAVPGLRSAPVPSIDVPEHSSMPAAADAAPDIRQSGSSMAATMTVGRIERMDAAPVTPGTREHDRTTLASGAPTRGASPAAADPSPPAQAVPGHHAENVSPWAQAPGRSPGPSSAPWPGASQPWIPAPGSAPPSMAAPATQAQLARPTTALPSPWRMPALPEASAGFGPSVPSLARALPAAAARSGQALAGPGESHESTCVAHAGAVTTSASMAVPASPPAPAPWAQSASHSDAVEPIRPGDDELARHVLRILIAEARREGLEI